MDTRFCNREALVTLSGPVRGVVGVEGGPEWKEEWVGVKRKWR